MKVIEGREREREAGEREKIGREERKGWKERDKRERGISADIGREEK